MDLNQILMEWETSMKKIGEQQFNEFKASISNLKEVSRKEYLCLFLNRFLGNYLHKNIDNDKFDTYCHKVINSISLCEEEIEFFHEMVDHSTKNNYIDELIEIYHRIDNLENCQLGENILKCLDASKELIII